MFCLCRSVRRHGKSWSSSRTKAPTLSRDRCAEVLQTEIWRSDTSIAGNSHQRGWFEIVWTGWKWSCCVWVDVFGLCRYSWKGWLTRVAFRSHMSLWRATFPVRVAVPILFLEYLIASCDASGDNSCQPWKRGKSCSALNFQVQTLRVFTFNWGACYWRGNGASQWIRSLRLGFSSLFGRDADEATAPERRFRPTAACNGHRDIAMANDFHWFPLKNRLINILVWYVWFFIIFLYFSQALKLISQAPLWSAGPGAGSWHRLCGPCGSSLGT